MCNFLEYKGGFFSAAPNYYYSHSLLTMTRLPDSKVVYRRYASLFFIAGCASTDNELITLEIVHRYVEQMDKYYGNVCELDIIFNFQKAYFILDELLLAGEMQESSKKNVLRCISQQDSLEDMEVSSTMLCACCPSSPTGIPCHALCYSQYLAVGISIPCLSLTFYSSPFSPRRNRANALRPRLRKMWSPRSCSDRDSRHLFLFFLHWFCALVLLALCYRRSVVFSILFFPTNQYYWCPFSGLGRRVAQLGPSRAVRARLDPWNSGPNQSGPRLAHLVPVQNHSESMLAHAGPMLEPHGHSFHSVHALLTTTTGHPKG